MQNETPPSPGGVFIWANFFKSVLLLWIKAVRLRFR
jgi:hypothetical protein